MNKLLAKASPEALFILGLFTLPAFLFQEKLPYRLMDGLFFLILALYSGKRILPLPAMVLLASVTAAALLVPSGKVLISVFGFPITLGALKMGFSRGILLLGLFYLSKFTVVQGLVLPGKTGNGLAKVFFYFERFSEHYSQVSIRDLPGSLDTLLLKVSETSSDDENMAQAKREGRIPLILPLLISITCWIFLLL
ncbi:hypothetical protein [Desulfopila sp. IMCC35008]|uniref:hypothetical protein n=1 Tax=Desulfopila sp. IMCC35008 TaxID=2653858 RepID=UPI0013D32E4B|nr:hypothetical protein [Desulfopila sp. IMCC35008]